jgi:hypothetical protein
VKLVVIYGPPAVGKLTTANALAKLTGLRVFHNHLSFDLVKALFQFPTPAFLRLLEAIRLRVFEAAAQEGLRGLIFTFVYAPPDDDPFVESMVRTVEQHGGTLAFVRLHCDRATNEKRVTADERRGTGKIVTVESLRAAFTRADLTARIPFRDGLDIDNSGLTAEAAARKIVDHFSLVGRARR